MPDKEKLSYALGMTVANNIKRDELDLDVDTFATAMKEVLGGKTTRFTEEQLKETMTQFSQALPNYVATLNKTKGEEYLAKNAKAPGVTILTNGLQYKVLKEGTGPMPKTSDTVVVSYKGSLINGTVFDHNDHFSTPVVGRTIKGWSEILPLMKTGSEWEVAIPSDLGYGPRASQKIGANSVLVFDIELLSIAPPAPAPAPVPAPTSALKPSPTPVSIRPPGSAPQNLPPSPPTPPGAATTTTPVVSGQIIKVPSKEELDKGAKIEVITNVPNN
jgi:FKBP-type peptidyl-prolyl cis-trans isomerase